MNKPNPIVQVMAKLARRYKTGDMQGAVTKSRWRRVEVTMHEIAHGFTLGLDMSNPHMSHFVSEKHDQLNKIASDAAEIEACALEALVLKRFKVPVTAAMLASTAATMMKTEHYYRNPEAIERDVGRAMRRKHVRELAWSCEHFLNEEAK